MENCGVCHWLRDGRCKRHPLGADVELTDWCGDFLAARAKAADGVDQDVAKFVSSGCERSDAAREKSSELLSAFRAMFPRSQIHDLEFGRALGRLGIGSVATGGVRYRTGIRLA